MADFKFEKKFRLLSAKDFDDLKIGSSSYKKASVIIYYKKNSFNLSRIGISVPKKIGKSHDRNRIKRLIREYFRQSNYKFLGYDMLFVVSWSRNLFDFSPEEKEVILRKNLNEYFSFSRRYFSTFKVMKFIFIFLIKFYQYFISPLLGPNCRFYPTCSEYSKECFKRFPIFKAVWYSFRRISKCHPFCDGGHDPVPHDNE